MLMQRQAPVALSVLAACAVMASGSVLLRQQILHFSSWSPGSGAASDTPYSKMRSSRAASICGPWLWMVTLALVSLLVSVSRIGLPGVRWRWPGA